MNPLVSVVIPTYKRPTDLKRAIDSVLRQTYENIEIKVVDDNNADTQERAETESLMALYSGNQKIEYIKHEKNKNGSAARNTGWRVSKGKYITFLDDDDEMSPEKLKRQVECLESLDPSWGACYTAYRVRKTNGRYQISYEKRSGDLYVEALMRTMFMGSGSNLFLRKPIVDEINGYDERFMRNQDIEFMARALEKYKLAYIDEVLLTIHFENRPFRCDFDKVEEYTKYYLHVFAQRFEKLSENDRKRVLEVISLERARTAISCKKIVGAFNILIKNKVGIIPIIKYSFYIIHRLVTHKSYGFSL